MGLRTSSLPRCTRHKGLQSRKDQGERTLSKTEGALAPGGRPPLERSLQHSVARITDRGERVVSLATMSVETVACASNVNTPKVEKRTRVSNETGPRPMIIKPVLFYANG